MLREIDSAIQVLLACGLIVLVLMHSGKDSGLSGMLNPGGSSFGGTVALERNLTRMTIVVAIVFAINGMLLGYLINH